jgi:hypothetical protein
MELGKHVRPPSPASVEASDEFAVEALWPQPTKRSATTKQAMRELGRQTSTSDPKARHPSTRSSVTRAGPAGHLRALRSRCRRLKACAASSRP